MAWSGSTRWAPASARSPGIGSACSPWAWPITCWRCWAAGCGGGGWPMRAKWLRRLATAVVVLALAGGVAVVALRPTLPPPIIGMVRTTEIKIEPEVSGRIAALPFKAGDRVSAGAVVAELSNPELAAAVEEARAAVAVAQA